MMRRSSAFISFALSAFAFCGTANAECALEHSTAPLLRAAAEKAAAYATQQYAFTVEHWDRMGDKEAWAKIHFDPRLPEGEQWTVLEPTGDKLDKRVKKVLKEMQKAKHVDHPLLYGKLDEMLEHAEFVEENDDEAVFVTPVDGDDFPKDALEVYMTLNKAGGYVSRIDVKTKKSFRPLPVAVVKHMVQTQFFNAPQGDGPALLMRTEGIVEGEAMFKDFKQESWQVFTDIEPVDVGPHATGE